MAMMERGMVTAVGPYTLPAVGSIPARSTILALWVSGGNAPACTLRHADAPRPAM
jgi:hypothetical protein